MSGELKMKSTEKWDDDDSAEACTICMTPFAFFRRRHHCRACGRVVCAECSEHSIHLVDEVSGCSTPTKQRVCTKCYHLSLSSKAAAKCLEILQVTKGKTEGASRSYAKTAGVVAFMWICINLWTSWTISIVFYCWSSGDDGIGCNSLTRGVASTVEMKTQAEIPQPPYVASAGYSAAYREGIELGNSLARSWLGSCNTDKWFLIENGGDAAAYTAVKEEMCEFDSRYCSDYVEVIFKAMNELDDHAFTKVYSSCYWGDMKINKMAVFMPTSKHDLSNGAHAIMMGAETAIHEYTHVYQRAVANGVAPSFLVEGGATMLPFAFRDSFAAPLTSPDFRSSIMFGGRGGALLNGARKLYATTTPALKWFKDYAVDRCLAKQEGLDDKHGMMVEGIIYYDMGMIASWFMIHKAQQRDSSVTLRDFWVTQGDKGFWQNLHADDSSVTRFSRISDTPEGTGWKKALCDFTGYDTYADFADAFENWFAPGGTVISDADFLAILPSNNEIRALVAIPMSSIPNNYVAHDGSSSVRDANFIVLFIVMLIFILLGVFWNIRISQWYSNAADERFLSTVLADISGISFVLNAVKGFGTNNKYMKPSGDADDNGADAKQNQAGVELVNCRKWLS